MHLLHCLLSFAIFHSHESLRLHACISLINILPLFFISFHFKMYIFIQFLFNYNRSEVYLSTLQSGIERIFFAPASTPMERKEKEKLHKAQY